MADNEIAKGAELAKDAAGTVSPEKAKGPDTKRLVEKRLKATELSLKFKNVANGTTKSDNINDTKGDIDYKTNNNAKRSSENGGEISDELYKIHCKNLINSTALFFHGC